VRSENRESFLRKVSPAVGAGGLCRGERGKKYLQLFVKIKFMVKVRDNLVGYACGVEALKWSAERK
jgi:hypothetical protein